jgi:hypothetical protein
MELEHEGIRYNLENDVFVNGVDIFNFARYLKGRYGNVARCKSRFLDFFYKYVVAYDKPWLTHSLDLLASYVNKFPPFSYEEAFKIEDDSLRALVFGSINVPDMIRQLGSERVNVEGKEVTHRDYNEDGSYTMRTYSIIYELHKVSGEKLNIEDVYAVKCWCTTTDKEHWLWVEDEYAQKGALEAIASTMRVYENMIPHIVSIKRQGDVLLFEMDKEIEPAGNIIPLTAEQYFGWLVSQS